MLKRQHVFLGCPERAPKKERGTGLKMREMQRNMCAFWKGKKGKVFFINTLNRICKRIVSVFFQISMANQVCF